MPINLTGVENHNEFYSTHYLHTILEEDVKKCIIKWKEQATNDSQNPSLDKFLALPKKYFAMRDNYQKQSRNQEKLDCQREFFREFLHALGFNLYPTFQPESALPILAEINNSTGKPYVWVLEGVQEACEFIDPLKLKFIAEQHTEIHAEATLYEGTFEDLLTKHLFTLHSPPRWLIILCADQVMLIDRTKWDRKCSLSFDLTEIFNRKETSTMEVVATLLHRESLAPLAGESIHDEMGKNSHKHAHAISEDLKFAIRDSIELLANEAVYYFKKERKEKVYGIELAKKLSIECLRYMYRLLFLFYLESRPELGYVPKCQIYQQGYSLEALRDHELLHLETEKGQEGYFLYESLERLLTLIKDGTGQEDLNFLTSQYNTFTLHALSGKLFDPQSTPELNKVKFRNSVLQKVIRSMSLSRPKSKKERPGRISYSDLSIIQLGAVYESLLSFRGFFAETDLYEVKSEKEEFNEMQASFFVEEKDLVHYSDNERFDKKGKLKKHDRGSFIYRISGRDRQNSASYYTPEVLTECLVERALNELIITKSADELLQLTICEPAMGSGAFLNKAVELLAEAYLQKKQKETGQRIDHDDYKNEKQKVKMFLSDRNIFGVDLNSTAVELAEVSLWLNSIYKGAHVPWFEMQLANGNSLIGARREVIPSQTLLKRKGSSLESCMQKLKPSESRDLDAIYHFLLPVKEMAGCQNKDIQKLEPDAFKAIKEWAKEFNSPFSENEILLLKDLSSKIDTLWDGHTESLVKLREEANFSGTLFGQNKQEKLFGGTTKDKEARWKKLLEDPTGAYRKIKLVMDYWCALWFWPLKEAKLLPSRSQWLAELSLILLEDVKPPFITPEIQEVLNGDNQLLVTHLANLEPFIDQLPRLKLVSSLAERYHFFHWELHFADILLKNGGFDLIIGNPPWIKLSWNETDLLAEKNPLIALRKTSASDAAKERSAMLEEKAFRSEYLSTYESVDGTQRFLNSTLNWPLLNGSSPNLYKFFIEKAWSIGHQNGISAFIHENGLYEDTKGGEFRAQIYPRLSGFYHFKNSLGLFKEVDSHKTYSINIYHNAPRKVINFKAISNLFHPEMIERCEKHDGLGDVPGIKDSDNKWCLEGHSNRILHITEKELGLFAMLFDESGTSARCAKLPVIHAQQYLGAMQKLGSYPQRLEGLGDKSFITSMWHETGAQKDNTIQRKTGFCKKTDEVILSGPHISLGNPCYKTARELCTENSHYDPLDLSILPENYLPRTNYLREIDEEEYNKRIKKTTWDKHVPVCQNFRLMNRGMLNLNSERTFQCAIVPKGITHVNSCVSTGFLEQRHLLAFATLSMSLPVDYFVKMSGKSNALPAFMEQLPLLKKDSLYEKALFIRTLRLNCLTTHYSELWEEMWDEDFRKDCWTKEDGRLNSTLFSKLNSQLEREHALRSDFSRRQALVEIDVLAAMEFDLTLNELLTIYRLQFPILQENERSTWYDQNGRIIFTPSRGIGLPRPHWEEIQHYTSGEVIQTIMDDTQPGGKVERQIAFQAPFDKCSRENDYRLAWEVFEKRFSGGRS